MTNTHLVSATQHLSSASASASASAIADATKAGASSNHTGTIIGVVVAVIGGLAAIFFLATFFMVCHMRKMSKMTLIEIDCVAFIASTCPSQ